MMARKQFHTPDFQKAARELRTKLNRTIPVRAGTMAKNHFRKSFRNQGFTDRTLQPWRPTKSKGNQLGAQSEGILIESGHLRGSIRVANAQRGEVEVTAGNQHVKYARIHNEGGTVRVPVTQRARRFFWAMFYETSDEKWKWMALTKKQSFTIRIPRRKFMGHSKVLYDDIRKMINKELGEIERRMSNR